MALLLLLVLAEAAPNNPGGIDGGAGPAKTPVPCFAEHASCPSVFGMNQSGCCALASPNAICCETVLVGYEIKDNFHLPLTIHCYKRSLEAFYFFCFFGWGAGLYHICSCTYPCCITCGSWFLLTCLLPPHRTRMPTLPQTAWAKPDRQVTTYIYF